jgi:hypothetical protein
MFYVIKGKKTFVITFEVEGPSFDELIFDTNRIILSIISCEMIYP